eukprot:scaffold108758_cov30-Tisochrysis_lutea.AAC.5
MLTEVVLQSSPHVRNLHVAHLIAVLVLKRELHPDAPLDLNQTALDTLELPPRRGGTRRCSDPSETLPPWMDSRTPLRPSTRCAHCVEATPARCAALPPSGGCRPLGA